MEANSTIWRVMSDVAAAEAYAVLERDRVWNSFAIAYLLPPFRAYSQLAIV